MYHLIYCQLHLSRLLQLHLYSQSQYNLRALVVCLHPISSIFQGYIANIHIFSLCLLALMYKRVFKKKDHHHVQPMPKEGEPFTNSIRDSVPTILIVAATIIFFTTVYSVFLHSTEWLFPNLPHYFDVLVACVLEYTNGLYLLPNLLYGNSLLFAAALVLTTQSFSIHLQVIVLARTAKIAVRPYLIIRFLYSILTHSLIYTLNFFR